MLVKVVALLLAVVLAVESLGQLAGAPEDADMDNPEVQDALRFAVAQYNAQTNSVYISDALVIKVQTQVVAGINYIFTVEMARTCCKKGETRDSCSIHPDPNIAQSHECKLVVWSQPWLNSMILTENTC